MINILSISGSPVEGSSTELLLHRVASSIIEHLADGEEARLTTVQISDLNFIPCQACGRSPGNRFCLFDDDLTPVYRQLELADCLLFGSPVYFDSVSAQAKSFIDRCNCFRPPDWENVDPKHDFIKRIKRKRPGGMVLVGGERGWFEGARRVIAGFFRWIEVANEGMVTHHSPSFRQRGTAASDQTALQEADALGRHLAACLTPASIER
jgi:multimeric flavodoxin WrbA